MCNYFCVETTTGVALSKRKEIQLFDPQGNFFQTPCDDESDCFKFLKHDYINFCCSKISIAKNVYIAHPESVVQVRLERLGLIPVF